VRALTVIALALVVTGVAAATPDATRRPAPAVTGISLDGKRVSLASMRGKPVLINVWSSW
jgi:cytochrome c biogenesis protein CcmG/thiol:disulfide interchange protein DsbE